MIKIKCLILLVTSLLSHIKSFKLNEICITTTEFEEIYEKELGGKRMSYFFKENTRNYELEKIPWSDETEVMKVFRYPLIKNSSKKKEKENFKNISNSENPENPENSEFKEKEKDLNELIKIYQLSSIGNSLEVEFCLYEDNYIYFLEKDESWNLYHEQHRERFKEFNQIERLWSYRELANTLKILKNNGFLHKDIHPLKIKLQKKYDYHKNSVTRKDFDESEIKKNISAPIKLEIINNIEKINTQYNPQHLSISPPEINPKNKNTLTENGCVFSFALSVILIEIGILEFEKIMGDEFLIIMNDKGVKKKHEVIYNIAGELLYKNNFFEHSYYAPGIFKEIKNWFLSFFIDNSLDRIYTVNELLLKALNYHEIDRLSFEEIVNKLDLLMKSLPGIKAYRSLIKERKKNKEEEPNFETLKVNQLNII